MNLLPEHVARTLPADKSNVIDSLALSLLWDASHVNVALLPALPSNLPCGRSAQGIQVHGSGHPPLSLTAETSFAEATDKLRLSQANMMLNAAADGKLSTVKQLLQRGCSPDVCDYDKRTALMLATANGHEVRLVTRQLAD